MSPDNKIRIILLIDQIPNLFFEATNRHILQTFAFSIPVSRHATVLSLCLLRKLSFAYIPYFAKTNLKEMCDFFTLKM